MQTIMKAQSVGTSSIVPGTGAKGWGCRMTLERRKEKEWKEDHLVKRSPNAVEKTKNSSDGMVTYYEVIDFGWDNYDVYL